MEEAKNKALDTTEDKIVLLTTRVSAAEARARQKEEVARPRGTHDNKAGPSSTTQAPPSPLAPSSSASQYYREWEQNLINSAAVHLAQPPHNFALHYQPHLPLSLLKIIQKNRQARLLRDIPSSFNNTYDPTTILEETIANIIANQPLWQENWFQNQPMDKTLYLHTNLSLQLDPTYCPIHRRRTPTQFQRFSCNNPDLLNYPALSPPPPNHPPTQAYVLEQLNIFILLLTNILNLTYMMMHKIMKMLIAALTTYNPLIKTQLPFTRFL